MKSQLEEQLQRLGLSPRKAALLAGLGLALMGIIVFQFIRFSGPEVSSNKIASRPKPPIQITETARGSGSPQNPDITPTQLNPSAPADRGRSQSNLAVELPYDTTAPPDLAVPIAQILRLDPFTPPRTIPTVNDSLNVRDDESDNTEQNTGVTQERRTADLPVVPVQRIAIGPTGATVLINGAWLAVGDRWNGFRIQAIRVDGVVLESE